jgi:uncharacterized membrane protein YhaH (DUF805 family)
MHYYIEVLKKYCVFSGRARRSEYWYFVLFNSIICICLFMLALSSCGFDIKSYSSSFFMRIYWLYAIAILLPSLGVEVRRLHDIGKGGGWIFISFVPFIGGIWLLVLNILDSEPGENRFGANPKGIEE